MDATIIDQMNKFLKNNLDLIFVMKKLGRTRTNTAIKKIAEKICSNPTFNFSKNL